MSSSLEQSSPLTHRVYLALGSNLGDRRANLQAAVNRLRAGGHLKVSRIARLYETAPYGYVDQPQFLNTALAACTSLEPLALLDYLKEIEAEMGREPTFRNGPRPIDLDIIFYDELVLQDERLQLPHPRLPGRGFVLAPLAELAGSYIHPALHQTVEQLLAEVDLSGAGVELYRKEPGLELPAPRFLFLTGKLAEGWLQEFLAELAPRLEFEYGVKTLNIDVAAFMTCRFVADKLVLSQSEIQQFDLLILPGFTGGDLALVEQSCGVRAVRGPSELNQIEPFLARLVSRLGPPAAPGPHSPYYSEEQLRQMQSRLTDCNIRIYIDGQRVFAFNNATFGSALPDERELRTLFRQLKIDNAAHGYYLGRELYKAAVCIKLGKPYNQDREIADLW